MYIVDLLGIDYSPLLVTVKDRREGSQVRCPACWEDLRLERKLFGGETPCLGCEILCPDCVAALQVNRFVVY